MTSYSKTNTTTMTKLLPVARCAFTLALAISQFIFFGVPALEKYSNAVVGEAKIIEKDLGDGLRPPAITLCPFKYNYQGWKNATKKDKDMDDQSYNRWCKSANSTADFEKCIEENTFGLNDSVILAQKGLEGENITDPEFWTSDVSQSLCGRCHTLDLDVKLGINALSDGIILNLNSELTYTIFIHEPYFYRFAFNSVAMPGVQRILSSEEIGTKYLGLSLKLVRQERLNRAENPCNPEVGYKFSTCIKQSLSDTIGCKLPWDKHTQGSSIFKNNLIVIF